MSKKTGLVVAISTEKALVALEQRLAKLDADFAAHGESVKEYTKLNAEWDAAVQVEAKKALQTALAAEKRVALDYWRSHPSNIIREERSTIVANFSAELTLPVGFPKQPEQPSGGIHPHTYAEMRNEIEQAIRLLKMTDAKTIPASMVAELSRYL